MAAVLTVSDTAAASPLDSSLDTTGPFIASSLQDPALGLFTDVKRRVVSDDLGEIRRAVEGWVSGGQGEMVEPVRLIITTGGTGMSSRDVTVEAIAPLFSKPLPSLALALTSYGLSKTPLAALSNPLCGIITCPISSRRVLVVCLPGSSGGVKDGMAVLGPILAHVLSVVDPSPSSQAEHSKIHGPRVAIEPTTPSQPDTTDSSTTSLSPPPIQDHCCTHHHPVRPHSSIHQHPAPGTSVSRRQRQSPHPMISLAEASSLIESVISAIPLRTEVVPIDGHLPGHVLAESVVAPHNLPLWKSTNVDGYAVHSTDGPGEYRVRARGSGRPLAKGEVERVNTGGPVPDGADGVVMVEDTELVSAAAQGDEEEVINVLVGVQAGENVRLPGSDLKEGEEVMRQGEKVGFGGGEVGVLSTVGRSEVKVFHKPRLAFLSTGSELVDLSAAHRDAVVGDGGWTGIYDSNRPSLRSVAESMGWEVVDLGVVRDEPGAHEAAMRQGLEVADVVISTGGTSMGEADLIKPLLEHSFGATIHFGRVSMAPGKPTTFATIPFSPSPFVDETTKTFFALPGNPASALVTFYAFVVPALRGLGGYQPEDRELKKLKVMLGHSFPRADRPTFHRCKLSFTSSLPVVRSTGGQRSSRVASVKGADVLVLIEASDERGLVGEGEVRDALLLPGGWGN